MVAQLDASAVDGTQNGDLDEPHSHSSHLVLGCDDRTLLITTVGPARAGSHGRTLGFFARPLVDPARSLQGLHR